jgi:tetratricopeptide (TPR) repeat protein
MIGRLQDAVALFSQALALYRAQSDNRNLGRILCRIGFGYAGIGLLQPSRKAFAEAHQVANATQDIWIEARARLGLARIDHEHHNLDSALDNATRALHAFRALGDRRREARALNQLATIQADLGTPETALDTYADALALNRQIGDRIGEGLIHANKGLVLHQLGRKEESHHCHGRALQVFRELGHHRYQGHAMYCIAHHLHLEGRHLEAIGIAKSALTLLDVVGDQHGSAKVHVELSLLSLELDRLEEAKQHGARALDIATQISRPKQQAAALCCLGEIAFRASEHAEAHVLHLRQQQAAKHVGPEWVAIADLRLGQVARATNDLERATTHLTRALDALPLSNPKERALAHIELGWIALSKREDPTAPLRAARRIYEDSSYKSEAVARAIAKLQVSCH